MKSETITIRISPETADRYERLRLAGACRARSMSGFVRTILELGMDKYEKAILPLERGEEYQTWPEGKIIQFPGQG